MSGNPSRKNVPTCSSSVDTVWVNRVPVFVGSKRQVKVLGTGPDARGPHLLQVDEQPSAWRVRQVIDDPAGAHDWAIVAEVDLPASDAEGAAVVRMLEVSRL